MSVSVWVREDTCVYICMKRYACLEYMREEMLKLLLFIFIYTLLLRYFNVKPVYAIKETKMKK